MPGRIVASIGIVRELYLVKNRDGACREASVNEDGFSQQCAQPGSSTLNSNRFNETVRRTKV